jgi:hypothetical protein
VGAVVLHGYSDLQGRTEMRAAMKSWIFTFNLGSHPLSDPMATQ